MGGVDAPMFRKFVDTCKRAYNILRRHGPTLISLFSLMVPAGMPELASREVILKQIIAGLAY